MAGVLVPVEERSRWKSALEGIPHGFTHTWEYCHAQSLTTGLNTYLWCFGAGPDRLICPLMERPFDGYTDIATPPGISGFAGTGDYERQRVEWERFVRSRRYVTGYIGLHPLFAPTAWQAGAAAYNSLYILDLRQPAERLLERMDRNRRRELRAYELLATGITTDRTRLTRFVSENYSTFADRIALPINERWTDATLQAYCGASAAFLVGMEGPDGIVAAHVYAHTSYGAEFVLQVAGPNGRQHTTVLIWRAVQILQAMGVPFLNLGGGVTENDAIAQAKQRLGADRPRLTSLREVYNAEAYALLCRRTGVDPDAPGYFPAYRRAGRGTGS